MRVDCPEALIEDLADVANSPESSHDPCPAPVLEHKSCFGGGGAQEQQGTLEAVLPTLKDGGGGGKSRRRRCSSVDATPRGGRERCAFICWCWRRRSGEGLGVSPAAIARRVRGLGQAGGGFPMAL
jgi:hypothetical protein